MKHVKKVNFLKVFLNISTVIFILISIPTVFGAITNINPETPLKSLLYVLITIIFLGCFFIIIKYLKDILNTILNGDPFVDENILSFNKIGYLILLLGLIDAITNYPVPNITGIDFHIDFILTSYGSLKPIFFLYLILGCLAFILGDVFKIAIDIKNDNNLTI